MMSQKLGVVVPTVDERKASLTRTLDAYRQRAEEERFDIRFAVVRNRSHIGTAWTEGADALVRELGEDGILHLSADDVTPEEGALTAAASAAQFESIYPSPLIWNPDGTVHTAGTLGHGWRMQHNTETRFECAASPFPIMQAKLWREIGPVPNVHYYADDYLGWRARWAGVVPTFVPEYALVHDEPDVAKRHVQREAQQSWAIAGDALSRHLAGPTLEVVT